jgi:hypothetical protein
VFPLSVCVTNNSHPVLKPRGRFADLTSLKNSLSLQYTEYINSVDS